MAKLKVINRPYPAKNAEPARELQKAVAPQRSAPPRARKESDLPNSPEIERGVLAAILQNPEKGFATFERTGRKGFFFSPVNKEIYALARQFFTDNGRLDLIGFTAHLGDSGRLPALGGPFAVTSLFVDLVPLDSLDYYIDQLREKYVRRQIMLRSFAQASKAAAQGQDLGELLSDMSVSIEDLKVAAGGPNGAHQFPLASLEAFDPSHDKLCLVGRRWLVRGGSCLWAGASGIGKSSLAMQLAMYFATGASVFGLRPTRPLKSVIIQAENDEGDVAEQWQGVKKGITSAGDLDLEEAQALFQKNIVIYRVLGKTGSQFLSLLAKILEVDRPDLYWMDPLFAFAGCDLLNPEKVGFFLREGLFPLMVKSGCCANVLHHVGKPKQNGEPVAEIDLQYLGFGTSEIQNAFRAVNVLLPLSNDPGVFKLTFSKRGERAGARTPGNDFTSNVFLKHSSEGICWMQVDEPDPHDQKPKGRQAKYNAADITRYMSIIHPTKVFELLKKTAERGMSRATFFRIWDKLESEKLVKETLEGWLLNNEKTTQETSEQSDSSGVGDASAQPF